MEVGDGVRLYRQGHTVTAGELVTLERRATTEWYVVVGVGKTFRYPRYVPAQAIRDAKRGPDGVWQVTW